MESFMGNCEAMSVTVQQVSVSSGAANSFAEFIRFCVPRLESGASVEEIWSAWQAAHAGLE